MTVVLGFLRLRGVTLAGVWIFFIAFAFGTVTVMAAMYQPTSLGGDQHDQVRLPDEQHVARPAFVASGCGQPCRVWLEVDQYFLMLATT